MGNVKLGQEGEADAQVAGRFLLGQTTHGRQEQDGIVHDQPPREALR